nr:hypothetical protein [Eggerthella sinensis]
MNKIRPPDSGGLFLFQGQESTRKRKGCDVVLSTLAAHIAQQMEEDYLQKLGMKIRRLRLEQELSHDKLALMIASSEARPTYRESSLENPTSAQACFTASQRLLA